MLLGLAGATQAQPGANPAVTPGNFAGVGRAATPKEVAAWDIDVRPDFKGLPAGSGTVAEGMHVWEGKCASCHGVFGESNEVFSPIVGGTTADDIKTGRVVRLNDNSFPGRTTLMKLSTVSTLWDYINRAMPWTQPKSLSTGEVYAVTAYILNLGGIVADDFTLSDTNIAEVQQRLPNRNGTTTDHALWPGPAIGNRAPEVRAVACMRHCPTDVALSSSFPDSARNAHGNLSQQNRAVGAQRGADTTRPPAAAVPGGNAVNAASAASATVPIAAPPRAAQPASGDLAGGSSATAALLQKHTCTACHGMDSKLVGPGFREIAQKYAGRGDAVAYLSGKVRAGGSGVWGAVAMPAQTLSEADAKAISSWLANGAKR